MGANSNPPGNQEGANGGGPSSLQGGGGRPTANPSNGTAAAVVVAAGANSATLQALKHDPGLSFEWTADEQAILEEGLRNMNDTPAVMKQMPPLPVKIKEELATSILPRTS